MCKKIVQENPINIFKRACPLDMFANKRMLRLKTLAKYEINSIIKIKGAKAKGTPDGKKRLKKSHPLFQTHIKFI